jgi:hypothetical protein
VDLLTLEILYLCNIAAQLPKMVSAAVLVFGAVGAMRSSQLFKKDDSFATIGLLSFTQLVTLRTFWSRMLGRSS